MKRTKSGNRGAFSCEAASGVGRREVLAGLAAALALAPVAVQASGRTPLSDLANDEGLASAAARGRIGEEVAVRGYYAPAMRAGVLFDLMEKPAAPCPMCGFFHESGATVAVLGATVPDGISMLRAIDVRGAIGVDADGKAQIIARDIAVS